MNAAKYIRYILTIATALLSFDNYRFASLMTNNYLRPTNSYRKTPDLWTKRTKK